MQLLRRHELLLMKAVVVVASSRSIDAEPLFLRIHGLLFLKPFLVLRIHQLFLFNMLLAGRL